VTGTIRVVVVEDNDVFREALVLLLGRRDDIDVIADVAGGEEAVEVCRDEQPDVVLLDYRLPGIDGVQTTTALRAVSPDTAVVVLTASATISEESALREAGAVACLTKDTQLDEIVGALHDAAAVRQAARR
jgi:DNA-binding NarL/FixJ family response regulator